ncbi:MAG: hypothetical protein K9G33_10210 [Sneathiella sp.]|nr:hypothetical protein [Sneathiella sp.]
MSELGVDLWGAAFQAISFLCLMAIPWTDGRIRIGAIIVAALGILSILGFQLYVGVEKQDYGLAADLVTLTLANVVMYFSVSWIVEKLFRLFLLKRKKQQTPPSS